jgi:hypothetical protein
VSYDIHKTGLLKQFGLTELLPVNVLNDYIEVDANLFDTQETEPSQPKM